MRATMFGLATAVVLAFAGSADASDYWPRARGHYDYHPGHFDRHGDHYHNHPGHFDYHRGRHVAPSYPRHGTASPYGAGYVQPRVDSYYPGTYSGPGSYPTYPGYSLPSWPR